MEDLSQAWFRLNFLKKIEIKLQNYTLFSLRLGHHNIITVLIYRIRVRNSSNRGDPLAEPAQKSPDA